MTDSRTTVRLAHGKVDLALHRLRDGEGARPLLVLHGLGEEAPATVPAVLDTWPGPIWALDFTGHGQSSVPRGGGYTAEVLLGDADVALARLGEATVYGRGLGAYVALLIAGGRPALVHGAILDDGPGLAGGGPTPPSAALIRLQSGEDAAPDPWALVEMSQDVRPPDYAVGFARQATQFGNLDPCLSIAALVRPPWLAAVVDEYGAVTEKVPDALRRYAAG